MGATLWGAKLAPHSLIAPLYTPCTVWGANFAPLGSYGVQSLHPIVPKRCTLWSLCGLGCKICTPRDNRMQIMHQGTMGCKGLQSFILLKFTPQRDKVVQSLHLLQYFLWGANCVPLCTLWTLWGELCTPWYLRQDWNFIHLQFFGNGCGWTVNPP